MISVLSTTKHFKGQDRINQLNAIRCWLAEEKVGEVVLFGRSEGIEELGEHPKLRIVEVPKANENGVPFVSEFFHWAAEHAKFELCMVSNADILYPPTFWDTLLEIPPKVVGERFLVVGERVDVRVEEELDFSEGWEKRFVEKYGNDHKSMGPVHSDHFFFPKTQYKKLPLPDMLIGRAGWDRYMFYHARQNHIPCIDMTYSIAPWHQEHGYGHLNKDKKKRKEEEYYNLKHFPDGHWYTFYLDTADYVYLNGRLRRNYAKGDLKKAYDYERILFPSLAQKLLATFRFLARHLAVALNITKNHDYSQLNKLGKKVLKNTYYERALDDKMKKDPYM